MNGSVQRNSVYGWEDFALSGDRTRAKPTELPVLPVHRKRGFITSANSDDTDQLLHLSSHISVFSTFASYKLNRESAYIVGVCRLNWVCFLYMQQGTIQSCWTSILAGMRTCAKPCIAYFFFFFNFGKDWWTTVGESGLLKIWVSRTKKLFFIVAFKWPTSWQSAERMSELWEDRPAYIFSSTARFAGQLHFHIFFQWRPHAG